MRQVRLVLALFVAASAAAFGCAAHQDEAEVEITARPGDEPWHSDDIVCTTTADCGPGEVCGGGVCQMARCDESYDSVAPMGWNQYFGVDGELAIISDASFVDGFEAADGSYLSSYNLEGERVLDVAGGALDGERPQLMAIATEYSDKVRLVRSGQLSEVAVGVWPRVIAAGDTDADGLDELVAFADDGSISLCHVDTGQCEYASIEGAIAKDVAVADVDGDGYHEPLFLFEEADGTALVVWNTDAAATEQEESYGWVFDFGIKSISAGDLDGDLVAEVVALEDGGWLGLADDKLHVFSPQTESLVAETDVYGHSADVAVGDRDADGKAEVALLREDQKFELFEGSESAELVTLGAWPVTVGQEAQRISMLDWDGDSASARYVDGPELVSGLEVPTMVMVFPPYPRGAANAPLNASVTVGDTETASETLSDTVSLSVGLAISFGADFGSIAKAKVGAFFNQDISVSRSVSKKMTIGSRYWVPAAPDVHGTDYAAVLVSCGCYHRYSYQIEDPADRLGGSGQQMDIYVPVGGKTMLMSSKRYNAMAEVIPHLPHIDPPMRIGDVESYPRTPTRFDGSSVPVEDLLFPEVPEFHASDVGFVKFWLAVAESETNSVTEKTSIGISGSIGGGGISIDSKISVGVAQGYSVTVGRDALFGGGIPPIPDDPSTPEDEFLMHRYSFRPIVYREHYQTPAGEDAGYYVLSYTVNK